MDLAPKDNIAGIWANARTSHELELGRAHACVSTPGGVTASVLALRDQAIEPGPPTSQAARWEPAYVAALRRIGVDLEYQDHELAGMISNPVQEPV